MYTNLYYASHEKNRKLNQGLLHIAKEVRQMLVTAQTYRRT